MVSKPSEAHKPKIFISYSRDDAAIIDQFTAALELTEYEPLIDRRDISGGENWKPRLRNLISEADSIIFMLSNNALASEVINWELAEVEKLSKRLFPVVISPVDDNAVPQQLQNLNQIFLYPEEKYPGSGFGTGLQELIKSLRTDLGWVREHTRIGKKAAEWSMLYKRNAHALLSSQQLDEAETWLNQRPKDAPPPTDLQLEFITESRLEMTRLESEARKQNEKMKQALETGLKALEEKKKARRALRWGTAAAFIIVAGLGLFANQLRQDAKGLAEIALKETDRANKLKIEAVNEKAIAVSASQSLEELVRVLLISDTTEIRRETRKVIGTIAEKSNGGTFKNILFNFLKYDNSLLPKHKYRVQLGVLEGLNKINGEWKATDEQREILLNLARKPITKDITYLNALKAAIANMN